MGALKFVQFFVSLLGANIWSADSHGGQHVVEQPHVRSMTSSVPENGQRESFRLLLFGGTLACCVHLTKSCSTAKLIHTVARPTGMFQSAFQDPQMISSLTSIPWNMVVFHSCSSKPYSCGSKFSGQQTKMHIRLTCAFKHPCDLEGKALR